MQTRLGLRSIAFGLAGLALAACGGGGGGGGHHGTPTSTATPAPTPTPTCPLPLPFCGGDFPLNTVQTTPYGPAWADVNLAPSDFLPCFGPYALCFYANCTVGANGDSSCPCFEWFGTNYVLINGILNLDSYLATKAACADPSNCQQPNTAPVCQAINSGNFLPSARRFSTFGLYRAMTEPLGQTDCSTQPRSPYAGCMTAPCFGPPLPGPDPHTVTITCDCPLFDGPYQIGLNLDPSECDDTPMAWSASYHPTPTPVTNPCDLVPGTCVPDAPTSDCGCPLYDPGHTTLPPGSGVDCAKVCQEYNGCNRDALELGYTCDATLCTSQDHDLVFDACLGLQNCDLSEIFKAESAADCSCCGSQLCGCEANQATNVKIAQLNQSQRNAGETPQCDINGTLCGTPPP
jgi:hypothetical protein